MATKKGLADCGGNQPIVIQKPKWVKDPNKLKKDQEKASAKKADTKKK